MEIDEIIMRYGYSAPETTEVINGYENMRMMQLYAMTVVERGFDTVWDPKHVLAISKYFADAKEMFIMEIKKGIKVRIVTDITQENLKNIKELSEITEIRHIDGLVGSFGILDGRQYMIFTTYTNDTEQPEQGIFSSVRKFVEQQQFVFDNLWKRAMPARLRINELEYGIKPDFVDSTNDFSEINRIFVGLMESARNEILLFFSNDYSFRKSREVMDFFILLGKALDRGVSVRLLIANASHTTRNKIVESIMAVSGKNLPKLFGNLFEIRYLVESLNANQTILIIDDKYTLVIDNKNDSDTITNIRGYPSYKENASGKYMLAGDFANYSNVRSSIWTNTSIFERYWTKSKSIVDHCA